MAVSGHQRRFPITLICLIGKEAFKFKDLEYAGTETAEQLFQDVQWKQRVEMRKAIVSLSKSCFQIPRKQKAAQDLRFIAFY
jgi:hypothetical protein